MYRPIGALLVLFAGAGIASAGRYFAAITHVDPDKRTITYVITYGKTRDTIVNARVHKDCVIKEGYYRLGKPAVTKEGDDVPDGLKNAMFKNATAEKPLFVNIYTADKDDPDKEEKFGDVLKILVNPPPRVKKPLSVP